MEDNGISWSKVRIRCGGYKILGLLPDYQLPQDPDKFDTFVSDLFMKNPEVISLERE